MIRCPLTACWLSPTTVSFKKAGYHDATAKFVVPGPGKDTRLHQALAVTEELARVKLVSDPPGAQVIQNGQLVAGAITPCDVLVEAGKTTRFVLTMPHRIPAMLQPFMPQRGSDDAELVGKLPEGTTLRLRVNVDARFRVSGAPYCQDVAPPFDCVVAPGQHTIELIAAQAPRITRTITVKQKDQDVKFELGFVEAGAGKLVQIAPGSSAKRATFEIGLRRVTVIGGEDGTHQVTVVVRPGATSVVN